MNAKLLSKWYHRNQFYLPEGISYYDGHLCKIEKILRLTYVKKQDFNLELAINIGYLHDIIEDTPCTSDDLTRHGFIDVLPAVVGLSKDKSLKKSDQMEDSLERIIETHCRETAVVKLADRLANLTNPRLSWSEDKINYYKNESRFLAERLGKYNPLLYKELEKLIN